MTRSSFEFGILLSSVVLVDCASRMLGGDDIGSEASAVVTATGSIVATQTVNGFTQGETPGDFAVTESGQASYRVPLWTPEGPMGMTPSLALQYDSSAGSGSLGVGWSLAGNAISKITRCKKTINIDNEASPIEFFGNTYCLDGERLLPLPDAASEYRTRQDDGSKIVRTGPDYAPTGFTVYLRNGQILTYGVSANAQLKGVIKPTSSGNCNIQIFGGTRANGTLAWALEKVVDRVAQIPNAVSNGIGNYMTITYTTLSSGTTSLPKYNADFDFKEMLVSQIDYGYGASGATSHRKVVFTYGTPRDDARYTFVSGLPIMSTKLLSQVDMYGPNPTTTQVLKTYKLAYDTIHGISGRSRLQRIIECDGAVPAVCKNPTIFTWEHGSVTFLDVVDPTPRSVGKASTVTVLDYNGDGKSDVFLHSSPRLGKSLFQFYTSQMGPDTAQGTVPSAPVRLEPWRAESGPEALILGIQPVDLDRDGRSDLALLASPGHTGGRVGEAQGLDLYRNTGNQFDHVVEPQPPGLGYDNLFDTFVTPLLPDLDGDGLPEEVQLGRTKVKNPANDLLDYSQLVFRRNVGGTLGVRNALTASFRSFTRQSNVQYFPSADGSRHPYTGSEAYIADIDGSGRQALLIEYNFFNPNQTPFVNQTTSNREMVAIQLSRSGEVISRLATLCSAPRGPTGLHFLWLDVNGDGLADAIDVYNSGNTTGPTKATEESTNGISRIRINTGAGFKGFEGSFSATNPGNEYALNARVDAGVLIADMNQDGLDDIVMMGQAVRNGVTDRSTVKLLEASTGTTAWEHVVPGFLLRTPDNQEIPAVLPLNSADPTEIQGSMPAALGDFNGDGLVDMVLLRPTDPSNPTTAFLHFYIHQGKKADQLIAVDTGTGRHLEIKYAPSSDPAVYRRMRSGQPIPGEGVTGPWEQPSECRYPLNCLTGGLWVVSRYDVTNDERLRVGHSLKYAEGRSLRGDQWLGVAERSDLDETDIVLDVTTYDNRTAGVSEHYPFAMRPAQESRIMWDNGVDAATAYPHRFLTTHHYQESANVFAPASFFVRRTDTGQKEALLRGVSLGVPLENLAFDQTYSSDVMGNATTYFTYDLFDNVKTEQRTNAWGEIMEKTYTLTNDPTRWLMGLIGSVTETSKIRTNSPAAGISQNRYRDYTYYPGTLLVNTETIENTNTDDVRLVTTYTRGAGALGQVTQKKTTTKSTTDDTSVPAGTVRTRTQTTTYDTVDGVTVAAVTNPLNQRTSFAYHRGLGVLAQLEDPNGVVTSYQYDGFGRIRKRSSPTAGDFTMSYEAPPALPSLIASTVSALGPAYAEHAKQVGGEESITTYNMNGRELVRQTKAGDGLYRYVLTRYRARAGQIALVSQPFLDTETVLRNTYFTYDHLGRLSETLNPDSSRRTSYYRPRVGPGLMKTTTDELGHVRDEEIDDFGRVVWVIEHMGESRSRTQFTYGLFSQLSAVDPPLVDSPSGRKFAPTQYAYDAIGRPIQTTEGDSGTTTRAYNAFGDIVKEVDAIGTPTFFKRDALGRATERSNARDGITAFVWDTATKGVGKLKSSTSFDGTTVTNVYDTFGRPSTSTWNIQGRNYTIKQTYDPMTAKLSQLDYPTAGTSGTSQLKVKYGYDAAGGISSVTPTSSTTPYWKATRWWSNGRIDQENDATNMVTTRVYDDNRGWPNSIKTAAGRFNIQTIQDVVYLHDVGGNVYDRHDYDRNTAESFTYDETNKLKTWTFTSGANTWAANYAPGASGVIQQTKTGTGAQSLVYDYFGDPASQLPHAPRKVTLAEGNVPISTKVLGYDAKGRQTSTFSNLAPTYTSFDLPKKMANGQVSATFSYDGTNHRTHKDYAVSGFAGTDHWVTTYVSDLYERRVSEKGVVSHVMYIRGPGGRVVAQETWTESGSSVTASPVLYHHDDIIGSTVVTNTTATAASATRLRYDPYGLRINPTNPTQAPAANPPTTIGFTGHEMDDEFNLINMKGRIYDPKIARFLTPDPLVSAPYNGNGYDRYGYALNNPMKYTDPSGFAMGTDPWLTAYGYGELQIDIYELRVVSKIIQAERENQKRAEEAERQRIAAQNPAGGTVEGPHGPNDPIFCVDPASGVACGDNDERLKKPGEKEFDASVRKFGDAQAPDGKKGETVVQATQRLKQEYGQAGARGANGQIREGDVVTDGKPLSVHPTMAGEVGDTMRWINHTHLFSPLHSFKDLTLGRDYRVVVFGPERYGGMVLMYDGKTNAQYLIRRR